MSVEYPLSVDYFVHLAARHRVWLAVAGFALCHICSFSCTGVLLGGAYLLIELFVVVNRISRVPSIPLAPLGKNDVALVTGGSGGLGLEIVKGLVMQYKLQAVYVLDLVEPKTDLENVRYVHCNLKSPEALDAALSSVLSECEAQGKSLSVVVNNAGMRISGSLLATKIDSIKAVFDVNTFAPVALLQRIVSEHTQKSLPKRLSIVTVSSVLGALGPRNLSAYSASKAAATQFHEVLQRELMDFPTIRMLLVMPGQLTTEMFSDVQPSRLFFAPVVNHEQLAQAILRKVDVGEEGVMCEPFYGNLVYMVKSLPWKLQNMARDFSQMDDKVTA